MAAGSSILQARHRLHVDAPSTKSGSEPFLDADRAPVSMPIDNAGGKPPGVAIAAVMRELATLANALLREHRKRTSDAA